MDRQQLMHYGPTVLIAVIAVSLFALGYVLAHRRRAAPALIERKWIGKMLPLMEAAASVCAAAKRERMVVMTVAEKAGAGPVAWFAQSIASIIPVYRMGNANAFEKLPGATSVGTESQSLYIQKRDYKTYASWARSMQ